LTAFAGTDESGTRQLLEMMRDGRTTNVQSFAEFAHTKAGTLFGTAPLLLAAFGQAQKNGQPMRVSECFECFHVFAYLHYSITIELPILCPAIKIDHGQNSISTLAIFLHLPPNRYRENSSKFKLGRSETVGENRLTRMDDELGCL
jgi:hypothetical protein